MKKKIISLLLVIVMAVSLAACGKENGGGSKGKNNPKEIMSAFSEYYDAYCEENYLVEYRYMDCIGRVIYFEGEPLLVIADMVASGTDGIFDVHFLAYNGKSVEEKYVIRNIYTSDDGFTINVDDSAVIIRTGAEFYETFDLENYAIYELKNGEVHCYLGKENEEGGHEYYEIVGTGTKPVEVDDLVKNYANSYKKDYYYFFSESIENLTYGALVEGDFTDYLTKLSELKSIDSEAQLEEMYCEYMGYSYSRTINDAINAESNMDGVYVDNKFYAFSKEEGLENLKDMPTSVQNTDNVLSGGGIIYLQTYGLEITENVLEANKAGCIIGKSDKSGEEIDILGQLIGIPKIFHTPLDRPIGDSGVSYAYYGYSSYKYRQMMDYGYLQLSFIDGYKISGLTKDSTEEDILNAGYQPTNYKHVYYNIYSEMPVDYDNIQKDYDTLYNSNMVVANNIFTMGEYIDYWDEYRGIPISYGDDSGIWSIDSDKEARYSKADYNNTYADEEKMRLAIASEMYLLNTGKIDYFVISQIDATDRTNDVFYDSWNRSIDKIKNNPEYGYDANTLSLYFISSVEDYDNWLKQAGWTE